MYAFARDLAARAAECGREGHPVVVAIDGPGCSGKTTLADSLGALTDSVVLATDDFHAPPSWPIEADSPLPYRRWRSLVASFQSLCRGAVAVIEPFDWQTRSLLPPKVIVAAPLIVVEGIASLHPDIAALAQLRVWVDCHAYTLLARVAQRDGQAIAGGWARYVAFEQEYLTQFRPWRSAHVHVLGAGLEARNTSESFSRIIEAGRSPVCA